LKVNKLYADEKKHFDMAKAILTFLGIINEICLEFNEGQKHC
jgi:hypothetical protein